MPPPPDVDQVSAEVLRARRYKWLAPDLVRRIAGNEVRKARTAADAIKGTKRRLHQVCGAYAMAVDPVQALARLAEARSVGEAEWRRAGVELMGRHASTRERLPALDRFYREIFGITGPPVSVIDLACGLGPLALPWMGLLPETAYVACDVDGRLVDVVDGFLTLAGQPHRAALHDVVTDPPSEHADVALLLKSAPCLEQQTPGSTRRLIERLDAAWIVVSYPTRSLGGTGKGMLATYRSQFEVLATDVLEDVHEVLFPSELVYVARRFGGSGRQAPALQPQHGTLLSNPGGAARASL